MPNIKSPYQTIQNEFLYSICDSSQYTDLNSDEKPKGLDTTKITNYLPISDIDSITYLYYTPKYEKVLNDYIYNQNQSLEDSTEKKYRDDIKERVSFLKNRIYTFPCHWGYPWCLLSCPTIEGIYLLNNLEQAKLIYSFADYSGGILEMKIYSDSIAILNDEITWIQ